MDLMLQLGDMSFEILLYSFSSAITLDFIKFLLFLGYKTLPTKTLGGYFPIKFHGDILNFKAVMSKNRPYWFI